MLQIGVHTVDGHQSDLRQVGRMTTATRRRCFNEDQSDFGTRLGNRRKKSTDDAGWMQAPDSEDASPEASWREDEKPAEHTKLENEVATTNGWRPLRNTATTERAILAEKQWTVGGLPP